MVSSCFIIFCKEKKKKKIKRPYPTLYPLPLAPRFQKGRSESSLSNLYKSNYHQFFLYFPLILYQDGYYGMYDPSIKIGGCNPQVWMILIRDLFLTCWFLFLIHHALDILMLSAWQLGKHFYMQTGFSFNPCLAPPYIIDIIGTGISISLSLFIMRVNETGLFELSA